MNFLEILKRMFVERYCVICGEAISYELKEPFCEECQVYWDEFLKVKCKICGRPSSLCTCLPKKIKKINHSMVGWCVFYDASTNGEIRALFTHLKKRYDREVIDLCAERMKNSLVGLFKGRGCSYDDYVITFTPRRDENVRKYGFDQSKKLAQAIGKKLGIKCVTTLKNISETEQKGLNKEERALNAQASYIYIDGSLGNYENVIIVDDIMTSGATMYACSFLLYKNGAKNIVPVTFARDNFKFKGVLKNVKRNSKYNFSRTAKGFV